MVAKHQATVKIDSVVSSVPLPSADLIIYRFDQIDAQLEATNRKLDFMTNAFMTKEDGANQKAERLAQIKALETRIINLETNTTYLSKTNERQQGSIDVTRRLTSFGLAVMAIAMSALAVYFGVHK